MQLIGRLKESVEKTKSIDEARDIIEEAGMRLTNEELDCVVGGKKPPKVEMIEHDDTELDIGDRVPLVPGLNSGTTGR